jgi:hypothetical protein
MTRMTLMNQHFHLTASEIAMGRVMRAPDHPAADEFSSSFAEFAKDEPAAGAADDKGGAGDGQGAGDPAGGGPGGAAGGSGDGAGAGDAGAAAAAADDKAGAGAATDDKGGAAAPAAGAGAGEAGAAGGDGAAAAAAAAAATDDKGGKGAATPPPPPAAASESDDDVLKRLAKAVKKVDTEEAPAAAADAAPQEQPLFTAEENQKIEHFRKEWPEVAEAFDLQARALAQSVLQYAFKEIGGVVNPMRETLDVLATRTHYGDLKEKVGEYTAEERDEIVEWVKQQPTYLQTGMLGVIDGGTAEEVADLVGRYREATGKPAAGAQTVSGEAPGGDVELSGTAKQAAAALAPVSTKRSAVQAPDDKSDFGAAFAKFADELG